LAAVKESEGKSEQIRDLEENLKTTELAFQQLQKMREQELKTYKIEKNQLMESMK